MKKLLFLLLFSLPAFGQAFYQLPYPLPGAVMTVCPVPSGGNPCPNPSNVYRDQAQTQLIVQPIQIGTDGNYGFWATPGQYTIQVGQPYNFVYIINLAGASGGGGTGNVKTQPSTNQNIQQPLNTSFNVNILNTEMWAASFQWTQFPTAPASLTVGSNTITLPSGCPLGVSGADTIASGHPHYVVVSGTGTKEYAAITGGTCTSGGSGTIVITTAFAHAGGYSVGGPDGIQEAERYAALLQGTSNPVPAAIIHLPKEAVTGLFRPIYFETRNLTIDGAGSSVYCAVLAACFNFGDTYSGSYNATAFNQINVENMSVGAGLVSWTLTPTAPTTITAGASSVTLTIAAGVNGFQALQPHQYLWLNGTTNGLEGTYRGTGELVQVTGGTCSNNSPSCTIVIVPAEPGVTSFSGHDAGYTLSSTVTPFFEDNAQGVNFDNTTTTVGPIGTEKLGLLIQNDNDQSEKINGLNINNIYPLRADSEFQGAYVFSPGPFGLLAGITNVSNSNLSLQCSGNAIEWYSGNGISVTDSIIQGWATFGSKLSKVRGGFGVATYKNVYSEQGLCINPVSGVQGAQPDTIINGYSLDRQGGNQPANGNAVYLSNAGQTFQTYYLVMNDGTPHHTAPIPIGYSTATSGTSTVVGWHTGTNKGTAIATYDILRVTGTTGSIGTNAPTGTGNYAVVTGLVPSAVCNIDGYCKYTDTVVSPSSYTVQSFFGNGNPVLFPQISHATSGAVVWSGTGNGTGDLGSTQQDYYGIANCFIAPAMEGEPFAVFNSAGAFNVGAGTSPCLASMKGMTWTFLGHNPASSLNPAIMFRDTPGFGGTFNFATTSTGILNLGQSRNNTIHDFITLNDWTPDVTESAIAGATQTPFGRRPMNANDIGLCADGANSLVSALCLRAGTSISNYVGAVPTGSNSLESLTATAKSINVNTTINGNLTVTGTCTGCGTGGGGGSFSSLVLGQPVYATSSTTGVSDLLNLDAGLFTGTDMCAKITAAFNYAVSLGVAVAVDARSITGNQVCTAAHANAMFNPSGGAIAKGGQLLLGNVSLYVDGASSYTDNYPGSPVTAVGTPAIILPNKFNGIYGLGRGAGGVATTISVCTGSNTPVTGCTTAFPARSFAVQTTTVAGNVMTINATGLTTGNVYTNGGGEYVQLRGSATTVENAMYKVLTVATGSITVSVVSGTAACASSCGTIWLGTPIIGLAEPATTPYNNQSCAGACNSFGEHLQNLSIDCQYVNGCIGVQNLYANEESGIDTILIQDSPFAGLDVHTVVSQNSGPYRNLEIYTGAAGTNCDYGTVAAVLSDTTDRGIENYTFNSNTACAAGVAYNSTNHPRVAIMNDKSNEPIKNGHVEGYYDGVLVGSQEIAQGTAVSQLYCGAGPNPVVNCVEISANYGTGNPRTSDDNEQNIRHVAGTTTPFTQTTIQDDINSISLTDNYVAMYSEDFNSSLLQTGLVSSNPAITSQLGNLTVLGISGTIQCVQASATGLLSGTGTACVPVNSPTFTGTATFNNVTINGTLSTAGPLLFTGPWPSVTPSSPGSSKTSWGPDSNGEIGAAVATGPFLDFAAGPISTLTVSASTTKTITFATAFAATPQCLLTPQSSGLTSWYVSAISTTAFTVTVAPSGTYTFAYGCFGH